jgi:predicted transcriptional regulator
MEGFLRSNLVSFGGKKINEYKYTEESSPALLTVFTAEKIDGDLNIRYYLAEKVSAYLGYRFDLSRIDKWEPYVATSSSVTISVNYTF